MSSPLARLIDRPSRSTAILYLVATALLWSSSGVLIKLVDWSPLGIAGVRSAIAAAVIALAVGRPHWTGSAPQVAGALCYAGSVTLFVMAMKWTTAANAILLQYTAPVYVAVLGHWLLGERTTRWDWVAIGIMLAGMALFFLDALTPSGFWGNICALISGFFFAGLILSLRRQQAASPLESVLAGNLLVATLAVPSLAWSLPPPGSWIPLVSAGIFQLGLAHLLYATALKSVKAVEASLVPMIEPILNPLWVLLVIGERPGRFAVAGGALVLGTAAIRVVLLFVGGRQRERLSSCEARLDTGHTR